MSSQKKRKLEFWWFVSDKYVLGAMFLASALNRSISP